MLQHPFQGHDVLCPACRTGRTDRLDAVDFAILEAVLDTHEKRHDFCQALCCIHRTAQEARERANLWQRNK